jgi:predicted amidophosphoribosyltransferase
VAQKTLSKLSERIQNARESLFLDEDLVPYERILLIDDALGSGATVNEMAAKLKQKPQVKEVYAFAIVGSLEGFEVIPEI